MILKYLYVIFFGILLALFVGMGIATFYPEPQMPNPPSFYSAPSTNPNDPKMLAENKKQEQFGKSMDQYQIDSKNYNKVVAPIVLFFAVVLCVLSLTILSSFQIFSDGFLLGGIFTLVYSIIRGSFANEPRLEFTVVAISFGLLAFFGYKKFSPKK